MSRAAARSLRLPGGVLLDADTAVLARLEGWVSIPPSTPLDAADPSRPGEPPAPGDRQVEETNTPARLRLDCAATASAPPDGPPTLGLGTTAVWIEKGRATLRDAASGAGGVLDLVAGCGEVAVPPAVLAGPPAASHPRLDDLLTAAAALLLNRTGRALIHAGAIADPDGRGWLVAGDARSGKSTTCATLARAGWTLLSDDQAVLLPGDRTPRNGGDRPPDDSPALVEGWPRPLRLDRAWPEGPPSGERGRVAPEAVGLERGTGPFPVGGLLLPSVRGRGPTRCEPLRPAEALVALLRQSPWPMADRSVASGGLGLLERVARRPARRLVLGEGSFGDPAPLLQALAR